MIGRRTAATLALGLSLVWFVTPAEGGEDSTIEDLVELLGPDAVDPIRHLLRGLDLSKRPAGSGLALALGQKLKTSQPRERVAPAELTLESTSSLDAYRSALPGCTTSPAAAAQLRRAASAEYPWPGYEAPELPTVTRGPACEALGLPELGAGGGLDLLGEPACAALAPCGASIDQLVVGSRSTLAEGPWDPRRSWSWQDGARRDLGGYVTASHASVVRSALGLRAGKSEAAADEALAVLRFASDLRRRSGHDEGTVSAEAAAPQLRLLEALVADPATPPAVAGTIAAELAAIGRGSPASSDRVHIDALIATVELIASVEGPRSSLWSTGLLPDPMRSTQRPALSRVARIALAKDWEQLELPTWRALLAAADLPYSGRRAAREQLAAVVLEPAIDPALSPSDRRQDVLAAVTRLGFADLRITLSDARRCLVLHAARAALHRGAEGSWPESMAVLDGTAPVDDPGCQVDPLSGDPWTAHTGERFRLAAPSSQWPVGIAGLPPGAGAQLVFEAD